MGHPGDRRRQTSRVGAQRNWTPSTVSGGGRSERAPHVGVAFLDGAADLLQQQRLSRHQLLDVGALDLQHGDLVERVGARR